MIPLTLRPVAVVLSLHRVMASPQQPLRKGMGVIVRTDGQSQLLLVLAALVGNKNKLSATIFFVPKIFLNGQHTCKSSQISHQLETNCEITF